MNNLYILQLNKINKYFTLLHIFNLIISYYINIIIVIYYLNNFLILIKNILTIKIY